MIVVGLAGRFAVSGHSAALPLAVMVLGVVVIAGAGSWLARRGVLSLPLLRARGVNLEARRVPAGARSAAPAVWLCAHLDTKSQPVPTLVRSFGVLLQALGVASALVLAGGAALGWGAHDLVWGYAGLLTLAGALPVVLSVVGNRSPGALDNASGVAAVVAAAAELEPDLDVGVLISDAEEFGLAGARAWSRAAGLGGSVVLNCDGVDDRGETVVMYSGKRPSLVLQAVEAASLRAGVRCEARRLALGILTDSVAFTGAGLASVTFSRGSLRSLARVHSKRDDLQRLGGDGIEPVSRLIAETARGLKRASS